MLWQCFSNASKSFWRFRIVDVGATGRRSRVGSGGISKDVMPANLSFEEAAQLLMAFLTIERVMIGDNSPFVRIIGQYFSQPFYLFFEVYTGIHTNHSHSLEIHIIGGFY